jgi:hypothetical protein
MADPQPAAASQANTISASPPMANTHHRQRKSDHPRSEKSIKYTGPKCSLDDAHRVAAERGGKCLSTEYECMHCGYTFNNSLRQLQQYVNGVCLKCAALRHGAAYNLTLTSTLTADMPMNIALDWKRACCGRVYKSNVHKNNVPPCVCIGINLAAALLQQHVHGRRLLLRHSHSCRSPQRQLHSCRM